MDDSQRWTVTTVPEIYGRGVNPGTSWAVAIFGKPITSESLGRIIPDPLGED